MELGADAKALLGRHTPDLFTLGLLGFFMSGENGSLHEHDLA
ncbi:MAG TPA: hypothetical protein VH062_07850 [Polyangiaceae bacterium]|nr:hypothetical protein [Polyangiaceae bacterium]